MQRDKDSIVGTWVRFGSYHVADGLIRPVTVSGTSAYEPWQEFVDSLDAETFDCDDGIEVVSSAGADRMRRLPDAPYQGLLGLVLEIERIEGLGDNKDAAAETAAVVAAWCSQHGLLGLLPHRTHSAFLVPRYEWTATDDEKLELAPVQRVYHWARGVWTTEIRVAVDEVVANADVGLPGGNPVPAERLPHGWTSPVAVFSPLDELRPQPMPLGEAWGRFFPNSNDQADFPYPSPATLSFWKSYCEPLDEFLAAARLFFHAVDGIALAQQAGDAPALRGPVRILETLAAAASPHLRLDEPQQGVTLTQYWVTPSLLSAYALMALFDVAGGRRLRRCADPKCNLPFRTTAYQGSYCCQRHRRRHSVARYRARKAKAKVLYEQGMPIPEIVAHLEPFLLGDLDAAKVEKWAQSEGWKPINSQETPDM